MANARLGDVVMMSEGLRPGIGPDSRAGTPNASMYLVCRLFTDAIFSNDIRAIQLIINRIDGGLPKDVEMDGYQTQFSDCLEKVMAMESEEQMKLTPDDTVMMGICKSLYSLATQDIYFNKETGNMRRRPPTDLKQERDAALRMVLERIGGRKTLVVKTEAKEEIEQADWISSLPGV